MATEILQLQFLNTEEDLDLDDENHSKIVFRVLREIKHGHIQSCHMSKEFAEKALDLIDHFGDDHGHIDFPEMKDYDERTMEFLC